MFDTVNFKLYQDDARGVNLLEDIPPYLDSVGVHDYSGVPVITGKLDNYSVSISRSQIKVKDGSLCKYWFGDNYRTLTRSTTKEAISKIADTIHLPMRKAIITRFDVAKNILLKYSPDIYFNHLGMMKGAQRFLQDGSLYYYLSGGVLCFYDKNREQQKQRAIIPDIFNGKNALRYERRFTQRIPHKFNLPEIRSETLYDEQFYIEVYKQWERDYNSINKVNIMQPNFNSMTTKTGLYKMGVLALINYFGGEIQFLEQLEEARKQGILTPKQKLDIKAYVNSITDTKNGLTSNSEVIQELDKKIMEAVRFYR